MQIIRGAHNIRSEHRGCVATIGNFDGVHRGHQLILAHVREKAAELNLPSTLICFEPQPREFFETVEAPPRLTRFREKVELLGRFGIDRVLCLKFNRSMRSIKADEFIKLLAGDLGVKHLVVGDDFRFGRDRAGDFALLKSSGAQLGFSVTNYHTLTHESLRVSSSRIRDCLARGDFELARELLGYPYSIQGRVAEGRRLGRELGTPTANIHMHRYRAPIDGSFAVRLFLDGSWINGVANVGLRPTIDDKTPEPLLEVHLFDFSRDIYGSYVRVEFCCFIRGEKKFANIEQLKAAIQSDIARAREFFAGDTA